MDQVSVPNRKFVHILSALVTEILLSLAVFGAAFLVGDGLFSEGYFAGAVNLFLALFMTLAAAGLLAFLNLRRPAVFWNFGPVLAFACAAYLDFALFMIPLWLFFFLAAYILYRFSVKQKTRLEFALLLSVLIAVVCLLVFCLQFYRATGTLTPSEVLAFVRLRVEDFAVRIGEKTLTSLGEEASLVGGEAFLSSLSSSLLVSMPSLALTLLFFLGYFTTWFWRLLLKYSGTLAILYPGGFLPEADVVSAAVYALCLLVTSLFASLLPLSVYAAFSAVSGVLELLFAFVGLGRLWSALCVRYPRLGRASPWLLPGTLLALVLLFVFAGLGSLFSAGGAVLLLSVLSVFYPIVSFFGLFHTVFSEVKRRRAAASDDKKGM